MRIVECKFAYPFKRSCSFGRRVLLEQAAIEVVQQLWCLSDDEMHDLQEAGNGLRGALG